MDTNVDQKKGKEQPPLELEYDKSSTYIDLPKPDSFDFSDLSLREAIETRRSLRKYSNKSLTLEELSWLLWGTQGVKEVSKAYTLRTVPSAGARHAFETLLLINNVDGLEPGIYRYLAINHRLTKLNTDKDIGEKLKSAALNQSMITTSNVTFIWIADTYRMTYRYGERGYRFLFLDAGHVCQNLYLIAEGINAGVCAIGAYEDTKVNQLLDLDGENLFVIYMATVGKKE